MLAHLEVSRNRALEIDIYFTLLYFVFHLTQIAKIREDVDYYVTSCRESDFEENEELYDDLKLEEASAALGSRLAAMNHDNDDHSSDVSSEAPSLQNSAGSVSPSPSLAHSKVITSRGSVKCGELFSLLGNCSMVVETVEESEKH